MSQLGGSAQQTIGSQLGADHATVQNGIATALPMLLSALAGNASSPGGAQSLMSALDRDHDGSILNDVAGHLTNPNQPQGAAIVGHVLGDRQAAVHDAVAARTGMNGAQVAQLMAMLAPVVMGALAQAKQRQGLDANGLAATLGNEHKNAAQAQPDLMSMVSSVLGGSGGNPIGSMLNHLLGGR